MLAMAYVPWQYFTNVYEPEQALEVGPIFPELDKPFLAGGGGSAGYDAMINMNHGQLMHWINVVSFAVVDITEYLDTHPNDEEALKYFNDYAEQRRAALRAYAENYGPLTIVYGRRPGTFWDWLDGAASVGRR